MSDAPVKQRIRGFIERHVRHRDFDDDVDIFAIGFVNSMFAMQLVLFVESDCGIKVEDEDLEIENFKSVNAIANLVEQKQRGVIC